MICDQSTWQEKWQAIRLYSEADHHICTLQVEHRHECVHSLMHMPVSWTVPRNSRIVEGRVLDWVLTLGRRSQISQATEYNPCPTRPPHAKTRNMHRQPHAKNSLSYTQLPHYARAPVRTTRWEVWELCPGNSPTGHPSPPNAASAPRPQNRATASKRVKTRPANPPRAPIPAQPKEISNTDFAQLAETKRNRIVPRGTIRACPRKSRLRLRPKNPRFPSPRAPV